MITYERDDFDHFIHDETIVDFECFVCLYLREFFSHIEKPQAVGDGHHIKIYPWRSGL